VGTELAAMAAIADALASVPDDAARFRVLRWAVELHSAHADADSRSQDAAGDLEAEPPPSVPALSARTAADPSQVVGDLGSLFDDDDEDDLYMLELDAKPRATADQPVVSMIQGFVKDFQKLARDWENA
jgi:hypothetical protein